MRQVGHVFCMGHCWAHAICCLLGMVCTSRLAERCSLLDVTANFSFLLQLWSLGFLLLRCSLHLSPPADTRVCQDRPLQAALPSCDECWSQRLTCSRLSKWFFMHFMATYLLFLMHWALSTSEKVPSPFLATSLYSARRQRHHKSRCQCRLTLCASNMEMFTEQLQGVRCVAQQCHSSKIAMLPARASRTPALGVCHPLCMW